MAQESESRTLDKVIVRLPDGMRDRIKDAAAANNRSMNAEIVATLEEKYPAPTPVDLSTMEGLEALTGMSHEELLEKADEINAEAQRVFPSSQPFLVRYEHEGRPYAYLNRVTMEALVEAQVAALKAKIVSKTSPSDD